MKPEKVQETEIRNYRHELKIDNSVSDEQIRIAIAEVEPWLYDDPADRHDLLMQAIAEPGSTL